MCVCVPSCAEALCNWSLPRHSWEQLFPPSLLFNPPPTPAPSISSYFIRVILRPLFSLSFPRGCVLTFRHSSSHWPWSCSSCCSSRAESPDATYWDRSVFMVVKSPSPLAKHCRESSNSCITHTQARASTETLAPSQAAMYEPVRSHFSPSFSGSDCPD